MRNFIQVGNSDVMPIQMALARHGELWDTNTYRTTFRNTPFEGMSDILLRYSRPEKCGTAEPLALVNDTDLVFYPAWNLLAEVRPLIFDLMRRFNGISLGRVIVARLPPGGKISPHADDYGAYATRNNGMRFHACVLGLPGCNFHCGEDTVQMKTGEVWWFRHQSMHSAENMSADERIHLLIDIETA